jgi:hypothetical protein
MRKFFFMSLIILFSLTAVASYAKPLTDQPDISKMKKYAGYFNFYWDEAEGKTWLEIDKFDQEFLYVTSLSAGLGSNDIGLDRNKTGETRIVKFVKMGPKILLIQSNYSFRADSENPHERLAAADAFATAVIYGFRTAKSAQGKIIVDATSFFLNDHGDISAALKRKNQGDYRLDTTRSAIYLPRTNNFPKNTEVEALLTFSADNPGRFVRRVAADSGSLTLRQHHSFIELPDGNYTPRVFDSGCGYGSIRYMDFATPIDQPIIKRFIQRHRLQKKDPGAKISEAVKPIVYYVDRGAPEPVRSALIEGAMWWNEAFEAIGYRDAFQVKLLPAGADPLDIRYNMINWVHRSTRGWSYGGGVTDPRTGEIIKGSVVLGSLRVRRDFLIAQGLIGDYREGKNAVAKMREMALLRIRQLSCHEVGHTLGLMHNYASSVNDRASVMDYPHPLAKLKNDGVIDLSDAYTRQVGEWDNVTIAYGYREFLPGTDEQKELKTILTEAFSRGLFFLTDQDARPADSAHPLAHLWDNGKHPVAELQRIMKIRRAALAGFSEYRIPRGMPLATLEEVLVPAYLLHRYQIEAASKVIGGLYYHHSLRGDNRQLPRIVPAAEQRQALTALLATIRPENLVISEKILNLIPPRPPGYERTPDLFPRHTGPTFDPLAAAENIANMTVGFILNPGRAARLIEYHARDNKNPGLDEVLEELLTATWKSPWHNSGYYVEIQKTVHNVVLNHLLRLTANEDVSDRVKAITAYKLSELKTWLGDKVKSNREVGRQAHYAYALAKIQYLQKNPGAFKPAKPLPEPAGSPIGD